MALTFSTEPNHNHIVFTQADAKLNEGDDIINWGWKQHSVSGLSRSTVVISDAPFPCDIMTLSGFRCRGAVNEKIKKPDGTMLELNPPGVDISCSWTPEMHVSDALDGVAQNVSLECDYARNDGSGMTEHVSGECHGYQGDPWFELLCNATSVVSSLDALLGVALRPAPQPQSQSQVQPSRVDPEAGGPVSTMPTAGSGVQSPTIGQTPSKLGDVSLSNPRLTPEATIGSSMAADNQQLQPTVTDSAPPSPVLDPQQTPAPTIAPPLLSSLVSTAMATSSTNFKQSISYTTSRVGVVSSVTAFGGNLLTSTIPGAVNSMDTTSTSSALSLGAILGIAIGVFLLLALIAATILYLQRSRQQSDYQEEINKPSSFVVVYPSLDDFERNPTPAYAQDQNIALPPPTRSDAASSWNGDDESSYEETDANLTLAAANARHNEEVRIAALMDRDQIRYNEHDQTRAAGRIDLGFSGGDGDGGGAP